MPHTLLQQGLVLLLTLLVASGASGQGHEPNTRLREIAAQDAQDRAGPMASIDLVKLAARDTERRREVMQMLVRGELRAAEDFFNASQVFHHGETIDDFKLAFSLVSIASAMRPERTGPKAAACTSWDRLLVRAGKLQWYGTQYDISPTTGKVENLPVDESAASDEDRRACGLPSLQELRARAGAFK